MKSRLAVLKDIAKRSKGWPVGIPSDDKIAVPLVHEGYLEWAPPAWNYPSNPKTYRLTTLGQLVVSGKVSLS